MDSWIAKTNDEIYVLSTTEIYNFYLFSLLCPKEGRVIENVKKDVATLKIVTTMQKWQIREEDIFRSFLIVLCCFPEKITSCFLK